MHAWDTDGTSVEKRGNENQRNGYRGSAEDDRWGSENPVLSFTFKQVNDSTGLMLVIVLKNKRGKYIPFQRIYSRFNITLILPDSIFHQITNYSRRIALIMWKICLAQA